jgi:ubiquinone/menaquinone biosynthesis C-methylase UbiE
MNTRIPSALFLLFILGALANSLLAQNPDSWEDRQTRQQPPDIVLKAIGLEKGMVVGEIGAGRGRYSVILAGKVGDQGHIYANDINKEDLEYLEFRTERDGIKNLSIILGEELDPLLPENKLDMLFIVNSYHHFSQPVTLLKNAYPALKQSGTLAIMEGVPGKGYSGHTTPQTELIKQMEKAGYTFVEVAAELEKDNIYIFRKD